jgi:putative SOS response-associated peptidase YedK
MGAMLVTLFDADEPLMVFAGIWVAAWESVRKVKDGLTRDDPFGLLTTQPNGVVAPAHPKAMPVILKRQEDIETWLAAPWRRRGRCSGLCRTGKLVRVG